MPAPTPPTNPRGLRSLHDSPLDDFLRRVNLLARLVLGGTFAGWFAAGSLAVVLVAVFSDAFFAWPVAVRRTIDVAAITAACISTLLGLRSIIAMRYDPRGLARLAEERLNRSDSFLINAVEFRQGLDSGSEGLRSAVVKLADSTIHSLSATSITRARPAARAMMAGLTALVLFGAAVLMVPRLFAAVVPRYLDPAGDHPPFTLLAFNVHVTPEPVHRGRPASIDVEITGPELVEEASLVTWPAANSAAADHARQPMFRQADRKFSAQFARVDEDLKFFIDTSRGRSVTHSLDVSRTPLIEEARATLAFPGYTGWPSKSQTLDDRGLRAIIGTEVHVFARSNLPLAGGTIVVEPATRGEATSSLETVLLSPASGAANSVEGTFTVKANSRFELRLKSTADLESDALSGPIIALPDRPPFVSIVEPGPTLLAVEGWKVPVEIQASDDVGIARLRLFRTVNGWNPIPTTLNLETGELGQIRSSAMFDLGELGAQAGDVITYYASADDRSSGRPQSTDTAVHTIQVISKEEYQDFARQQYQLDDLAQEYASVQAELERLQKAREEALAQLEELVKKQQAGEALSDEEREKLERLEEQLQKFAEETAELAKTLKERAAEMPLYDLEKEYTEELERLSKQLEQQSADARDVAQKLKVDRQTGRLSQESKDAAEEFEKHDQPFDQQSLERQEQLAGDLETLQKADGLNEQAERLQAVAAQQRELANRLGELAGKSSLTPDEQARADRFAKEQELLKQELDSIQKDLAEAADQAQEKLPKMANSARELLSVLSQLAVGQDQEAAAQQAREGSGESAREHADAAARKLESLQKAAENMQQSEGLQEGLDGPLRMPGQRLKNSMDQLKRGRRPPGVGQRRQSRGGSSGSNQSGSGKDGKSSDGKKAQGDGRLKPGQSGSQANATPQILGPRTQELVEATDQQSTMKADGKAKFTRAGVPGEGPSVESLTSGARSSDGRSSSHLRGVPVGYRDAAEAYLRKLSQENRSK